MSLGRGPAHAQPMVSHAQLEPGRGWTSAIIGAAQVMVESAAPHTRSSMWHELPSALHVTGQLPTPHVIVAIWQASKP